MKEKKTIIILILVLAVGIVGLTIAYFSNSSTVNNVFTTQPYGTTVTETFTSPSNWLPGSEVDKLVIATNTGNVDEAVRISLSENWTTAHNNILNGWITENGNKSSHLPENEPSNDERVAIINFDNASDWTYNNGYYYYNYKLSPNESTSSLIKSVTFNEKTKLDDTCVETPTATGRTITCESSGDDYDHATYTLTFNIETVQYNKYSEAWNTNYNIAESKPVQTVCSYEIGDEITYNDENYYVIQNSDSAIDYVTLLKAEPLTYDETISYKGELSDDYITNSNNIGYINYYKNSKCYSCCGGAYDRSECNSNYDNSYIKIVVDNWSNSNINSEHLVGIKGYKTRLVTDNELFENLGYERAFQVTIDGYWKTEFVPDWVNGNYSYWTMSSVEDSTSLVYNVGSRDLFHTYIYDNSAIRPVINLKKSAIESACPTH